MHLSRLISLLAIGFLMLPPALVKADEMIPLPIDALTAQADCVLHGKVVSTTVRRDPEGRIYTAVDLLVEEVWKGAVTTNHFTLVHGGGVLGDEVAEVSGEADYEVGEEIVSFLVLNKRGEGVSLGLSQGKFLVSTEPATGEKLVHNRFHGLHPSAPDLPPPGGTAARIQNRVTLAGLKQQVVAATK